MRHSTVNGDRPRMGQKKKRYYVGSIKARRGSDWVSAHFTKRDMTVAFTVYRQWPSTWESEGVEREIIQRLKKAKFDVVPLEDWGFIDRPISQTFRNGVSNEVPAIYEDRSDQRRPDVKHLVQLVVVGGPKAPRLHFQGESSGVRPEWA